MVCVRSTPLHSTKLSKNTSKSPVSRAYLKKQNFQKHTFSKNIHNTNMAYLKRDNIDKIIEDNRQKLYHLSKKKYPCINHYLNTSLYDTLLKTMKFIKKVRVIIEKGKYIFFIDSIRLTYAVRKKNGGTGTSNRHINLLCAIGLLNKLPQNKDEEDTLRINKDFLRKQATLASPRKIAPINTFYFKPYTEQELQRCEERASRLMQAGVRAGNMSFNMLSINGLEDIADEVYPLNNRSAPERKNAEFKTLLYVIEFLIEQQGYATRQQVTDTLSIEIEKKEIERVFRIYRAQLAERYNYKRPTAEQVSQWFLPDHKFIYTEI
jgi:hypothetical protein